MKYAKFRLPGSDDSLGRAIGGNFVDCLVTAKDNLEYIIIPEWPEMQFYRSINFDICPFIFDIPNIEPDKIIKSSSLRMKNINNSLLDWLRYCLNDTTLDKEKASILFTAGFPGVENEILINELRRLYKNNICPIQYNLINEVDEYIKTIIKTKNYISLYYRASGVDKIRELVTGENDSNKKFISKYLDNVLKHIDKSVEAVFLCSDNITIINYIKNKLPSKLPIYSLDVERNEYTNINDNLQSYFDDKQYSKDQTINYYRQTIKEMLILSKGKKIIKTYSKFGSISAIMSNLPYKNIITINPDNWNNFMKSDVFNDIKKIVLGNFRKSFKVY